MTIKCPLCNDGTIPQSLSFAGYPSNVPLPDSIDKAVDLWLTSHRVERGQVQHVSIPLDMVNDLIKQAASK